MECSHLEECMYRIVLFSSSVAQSQRSKDRFRLYDTDGNCSLAGEIELESHT